MNDSVSNCNCSAELNESMEHGNAQEMIQIEQDVEVMSEIKTGFLTWLKAHKKQLTMAGVGITTAIVVFMGLENKEAAEALWSSLKEAIKKPTVEAQATLTEALVTEPVIETICCTRTYTPPTEAFDVSRHIRTMEIGRHHSAAKAAEAAALGIDLLPNQTLVAPYTKCAAK